MPSSDRCLVYILGAGRSGSTLLGILLGNYKNVFYGGELFAWLKFNGIPKSDDDDVNKFWREVKDRINIRKSDRKINYFKLFEHHLSILRIKNVTKINVKSYQFINKNLFDTLTGISSSYYIVDSSHYPMRLYWLLKGNINIKVIYLIRHPVNVVSSFSKTNIEQSYKSPIMANLYLNFVSLLSTLVFNIVPKKDRILIKYEDLVFNTDQILKKLTTFLDLEQNNIDTNKLSIGKIFEGNRIRMKKYISIKGSKKEIYLTNFWRIFTKFVQYPYIKINNY